MWKDLDELGRNCEGFLRAVIAPWLDRTCLWELASAGSIVGQFVFLFSFFFPQGSGPMDPNAEHNRIKSYKVIYYCYGRMGKVESEEE